MVEELVRVKKVIESRKKEALNKEIWKKLDKIVKILGDYSDWGGGQYIYRENGLYIKYESNYQSYTVDLGYNTKKVYWSNHKNPKDPEINLYIPGEWEHRIDELYEKCSDVKKEREKEADQRKIKELKEKWRIE